MEDTIFITSDGYKDLQIKQKEKRKQEEKGGIGSFGGGWESLFIVYPCCWVKPHGPVQHSSVSMSALMSVSISSTHKHALYIYKLCIYPEDVNTGCHENMGTLTCHWSKGKLHTSRSERVCVWEALTCWRYSLTGVWQKIGKNCTLFSSALRQRLHFWEDSKHTHRLFLCSSDISSCLHFLILGIS